MMDVHTWFGGGTVSKLYAVFPDVTRTKSDKSTTLQTAVKSFGHEHECVGVMGRRGLLCFIEH